MGITKTNDIELISMKIPHFKLKQQFDVWYLHKKKLNIICLRWKQKAAL